MQIFNRLLLRERFQMSAIIGLREKNLNQVGNQPSFGKKFEMRLMSLTLEIWLCPYFITSIIFKTAIFYLAASIIEYRHNHDIVQIIQTLLEIIG